MRKLFRYIIRTLLVLLICVFSYFVYIVVWVHNFNDGQKKISRKRCSRFLSDISDNP